MKWSVLLCCVIVAACAGTTGPTRLGYQSQADSSCHAYGKDIVCGDKAGGRVPPMKCETFWGQTKCYSPGER